MRLYSLSLQRLLSGWLLDRLKLQPLHGRHVDDGLALALARHEDAVVRPARDELYHLTVPAGAVKGCAMAKWTRYNDATHERLL